MAADQASKGPEEAPQTSEERLRAVTVGERKPHNAPVHLAPYDPAWPARYERLAERIRNALGPKALLLEHVGSTSVPGLPAKPVIDIVLAVADSTDEPAYVPALEDAGFVLRIREADWFEHRLFKAPDVKGNVHVFTAGCEEIGRMMAFRDRLRSHEGDRRRYEETKRTLAARTWRYVQHYADAKSEVIREILARVLEDGPSPGTD